MSSSTTGNTSSDTSAVTGNLPVRAPSARYLPWLIVLIGIGLSVGWLWRPESASLSWAQPGSLPLSARGGEALVPLPVAVDLSPDKVALGKALFLDVRLSHDNTISCASCHNLEVAGSDVRRYSLGVGGAEGVVNAPSVFNVGFNFVQFWDGRAADLEAQASGPVHNPIEMASNWAEVLGKRRSDDGLHRAFLKVYPDGITAATIVDAIATFERSLLTPNSPFDRFLRGDGQAINDVAKKGYRRFQEFGCASCHQGVNIGGNMFQRFGVMGDYFADNTADRPITQADLGRLNVTGNEDDRYVFKVPSLRNVANTAPYFHDGSAATLDAAVRTMARYQLGRELSQEEIDSIVAFLNTLTGELPVSSRP